MSSCRHHVKTPGTPGKVKNILLLLNLTLINPLFSRGDSLEAVSKLAGEHKVHPYLRPEFLCRGESCIRPDLEFNPFLGF
jgi:hypothetical protein